MKIYFRILLILALTAVAVVILIMLLFPSDKSRPEPQSADTKSQITVTNYLMEISSPAFENNQNIPTKYTCDAEDVSPPLNISDIPEGTKSLALIVDDPDAPAKVWVHWTAWNMPATTTSLNESVPPPGTEGTTDFGKTGWGGPCPPSGTHRYFFKLYALDTKLDLAPTSTKEDLVKAMEGHILAEAELIGLYERQS